MNGALRANGVGRAKIQCADIQRCIARVSVCAGEREHIRAALCQAASTVNRVGHHQVCCAVKHQRGIVGDRASTERARREPFTHLQRACADGGGALIGVVALKRERARTRFGELACA